MASKLHAIFWTKAAVTLHGEGSGRSHGCDTGYRIEQGRMVQGRKKRDGKGRPGGLALAPPDVH